MARNIEIKARIASIEAILPLVQAVATAGPEQLHQDDSFFAAPHGRLKLRQFASGHAQLIAYTRADSSGPKLSDYAIAPIEHPDELRAVLIRALGTKGRVVKDRIVFWCGATRIHLDRVDGLGEFLELEVVLSDDQTEADGQAVAQALLDRLGIAPHQLVAGAYLDLLMSNSNTAPL
jgi:predicted adenylyl cyclase CyaB